MIKDDPVTTANVRGTISFATSGPNSRTSQVFINFADNINLDSMGFSPFGKVKGEGIKAVDAIFAGYGQTPDQGQIQSQGNAYLESSFPNLSYIIDAKIVDGGEAETNTAKDL